MYEKLTIVVPLIGGFLFVFVLSVLFRTACTDPGILPRSEKDEILFNERQALISMNQIDQAAGHSLTNQMINNTQMPRFKEIQVKGKLIKLKYCFTCKLYRPPRSSHCSVCDNCVEKFDHHCKLLFLILMINENVNVVCSLLTCKFKTRNQVEFFV